MKSNVDHSLARFLMILSLVLLGLLEYLWLHNEYQNKYDDMEDRLNHVMFSNLRDVEDSLIFTKLAPSHFEVVAENIYGRVGKGDSIVRVEDCRVENLIGKEAHLPKSHPRMRGVLLDKLTSDTSAFDTPLTNIGKMVMRHIRLDDSTGEFAGYELISWQNGDTVIRGLMSRPQIDVFAGKKIALINSNYKADIFHELLPHLGFALFLWFIVAGAFFYTWKNLEQQIKINALRDEFVSNITHELKTPITTVGVALESLSLSEEIYTQQNKRYLDICQGELKRLSMLVERILHNKSPQIHYEKIDVRQVLDDVMHHMKVQFDNKNAAIDVRLEGEGFIINGDKTHMSSVLYNLLENALKYSQTYPVIHVYLQRSNGIVRLDIKDNGIGIDPDYHGKIFEKLYRVPNHNRHDVKGHGLGLSYVADVVQKHQGNINLTSELGKGATFSMKFPAWHEN